MPQLTILVTPNEQGDLAGAQPALEALDWSKARLLICPDGKPNIAGRQDGGTTPIWARASGGWTVFEVS